MRPLAPLLVLCTALPALAQPTDAGLPGAPILPGRGEPAPVASDAALTPFAGTFLLHGDVESGRWHASARVAFACARGGGLTVTREGAVDLAPGARRRTTWSSTEVRLDAGALVVTFRPVDAWSSGAAGAVESLGGVAPVGTSVENTITATYRLNGDALTESCANDTRRAPEHFWSQAWASGLRARREDLAPAREVTTLVDHGPPSERYDLVLTSDGYAQDELPRFHADARRVVEALRATTPFKEYWGYINIHRVDVVSESSGVAGGRGRRAALGTHLDGDPKDPWRIASGARGPIERAAKKAPGADATCVLVNDVFRSVAHVGFCFVSAWDANHDKVAVHELGHTIGFLLDEYEENPAGRWDFLMASDWAENLSRWTGWGANLTTHAARREDVPWASWIPMGTPLPTSKGSGVPVGAYVGGNHMSRGWYRPSETCLMRDHFAPFCPVCREQVVLRLSQRTHPFEVRVQRRDADSVAITIVNHTPGPIRVTWTRSESFDVGEGETFWVTRDDSPWGEAPLDATIEAPGEFVRDDPYEWTTYRVRFVVDKGYAWNKGVRVRGPWAVEPQEAPGEDIARKLDRG